MSPREPARARLERLLWIFPAAAREGGIELSELAAELGVEEARILDDLEEVTTRSYYHPPEWIHDIEIYLEADRVEIWTKGHFQRPPRLDRSEALALALALRIEGRHGDLSWRERVGALRERLDRSLPIEPAGTAAARFEVDVDDPGGGRALSLLRDAARERRTCRIEYLKPSDEAPESRRLEPYVIVFAEGRWYALGRAPEAAAVRAFRLDRILNVEPEDATFGVPDGFEPGDYLEGGAVYRADEEVEAVVRYSPRIARWIEEGADVEREADGAVLVRHRVANPAWIVRHALRYGAHAEIVAPAELREAVRERLRGMVGAER